MSRDDILLWGIVGLSVLGLFAFLVQNSAAYSLPLLMIFGVIAFTAVLTIAGRVFSRTNLSCRDEALGLPSGSIRALIALSLIIIFAIMTIYMYDQLVPQTTLLQIPANQTILYPNGTAIQNPNGSYLILQNEPSQAQREFSMQTLTTVSTLIVALAGFYFGTKAVSAARGSEEKEPEYSLTIKPEGEAEYQKDQPLSIAVETEPKGAKFKFEVDGDKREAVKIGNVSNEFTYTPSLERTKNAVKLTFALDGKPTISKQLTVVVEKLDVNPKHGKVKEGKAMTIEVETTPADAKVNQAVEGDKPDSLKEGKNGKFTYTPSPKGKGRTDNKVTLTFELDVKPKITEHTTVEVEDKP